MTSQQSAKSSAVQPSARNVRAIARLEEEALHERSLVDRVSDQITRFSGTFTFVWLHAVWFSAWLLINLDLVPGIRSFDPFPFGLLTFAVSLEAIFLSTFVLISQNRTSRQADRRAHLDLQINLLAEQEMTKMLKLLTQLCEQSGIKVPSDDEMEELVEDTDVDKLAKELDRDLPNDDKSQASDR